MRSSLKHWSLYACHYAGLNALLRAYRRNALLVLCYHGVVPDEYARDPLGYGSVVSESDFTRQIDTLARLYHPISVSQLQDWWSGKANLPSNPVLVTLDDGYRNNLLYAAPILRRFGVPALINISVGYIGEDRILWPNEIYRRVLHWPNSTIPMPASQRECPLGDTTVERIALAAYIRQSSKQLGPSGRTSYLTLLRRFNPPDTDGYEQEILAFLSWNEVRDLRDLGFEIGSHSVEHSILTRVSSPTLNYELECSKSKIEEMLGTQCSCFTYPNGTADDFSPKVVRAVQNAGYSFGFTGIPGFFSKPGNPLAINRISIPGGLTPSAFHSRISGLHRRMHTLLHNRTTLGGNDPVTAN